MNTLVIVLLSILAWQLVVAIVHFASDENETITIRTAIGFWLLPIAFIDIIYEYISLMVCRRYNLYQFFGIVDGKPTPYYGWCQNFYIIFTNVTWAACARSAQAEFFVNIQVAQIF